MAEFEYLVTYGRGAYLGRFRAAAAYRRDDRVVVRTDRGVELGTVRERATSPAVFAAGDVLRPATAADEAACVRNQELATAILADAERAAGARGLPLLFLDGELPLDGSHAILQAVHWADCDATPLFEELSARHGLAVKLADLTAAPAPSGCATCGAEGGGGCSSGSCGTGGGCSSGSCSSGAVKSADELTAYFAGLRQQMESTAGRVSLG